MANDRNSGDGRRFRDDGNSNDYDGQNYERPQRRPAPKRDDIDIPIDRLQQRPQTQRPTQRPQGTQPARRMDVSLPTRDSSRKEDISSNSFYDYNEPREVNNARRIPKYEDDAYVYQSRPPRDTRRRANADTERLNRASSRATSQRDRFQSEKSNDDVYSDEYSYSQRRERRFEDELDDEMSSYSSRRTNGRVDRGSKKKAPIVPILLVVAVVVGIIVSVNALGSLGDKDKKNDDLNGGLVSNISNVDENAEPTPVPTPTPTPEPTPKPQPQTAYGHVHPELQVDKVEIVKPQEGEKIIYLTFDDGPCSTQSQLLDVLDQYGVKATLIVSAQFYSDEDIVKELKDAHDRGHAVSVHTYSHDYHEIYASVEAYLEDFNRMNELVKKATGETNPVYRFPGGSNTGYNENIRTELLKEMNGRNFVYYDWDIGNGDSEGLNMSEQIDRIMGNVVYYDTAILLMHNTPDKDSTIESLHTIIPQLLDMGYEFRAMDASVPPVQYTAITEGE